MCKVTLILSLFHRFCADNDRLTSQLRNFITDFIISVLSWSFPRKDKSFDQVLHNKTTSTRSIGTVLDTGTVLAPSPKSSLNISCKSVRKFLLKVANKQTTGEALMKLRPELVRTFALPTVPRTFSQLKPIVGNVGANSSNLSR